MSTLHPALAIIGSELCILACWWLSSEVRQSGRFPYMTCRAPAYKLSKGNLTTWQQYLQAGVDTLLILEQSFYLSQQGNHDAVSSAAQEYMTSDIPTKVNTALKDVFTHYGTTSKEEKVAVICNIITQNHMGKLTICINIPLINLGTLLQRGQ
ncbi:hypothetical protein EV363DRAFT_1179011 [Boletus edulis]|nr:hypothetical protein EV363DRAFT_1179011 [Boletus edulis]